MRGQIGYAVGNGTFRQWTIALRDFKASLQTYNEDQAGALKEMARTRAGRLRFAQILNGERVGTV